MEPSDLVDDEPTQEAQIRGLLEEFVEDGQSVGVVVGIVREGERVVVGAGRLSDGGAGPPDGDTVFEIGSITKVFTSTALADLELSSGVGLDTPVQGFLGDQVQMPMRDGSEITLEHLATHSSGLPRLPDNLTPADWANPYADYTAERLYEFLADHELTRDIGETVEYSNLGYGLLGHALALSEGTDYETVIA
ncbi:MAG: serine hydrolase, partial [Gemmatimonadetes bacterium]|nr:serine hydrolase [Gemmatimonadota bacterium]